VLRLPHARAEARVSEPHRGAYLGLESRRGVHPQREIQCTAAIKYHSCAGMRVRLNAPQATIKQARHRAYARATWLRGACAE
jgi:hypothetical protein